MHSPLPPAGPQAKPRLFELRMALIFTATIAANGIFLPYFPLWLADAGFDAPAIALILGAPMVLRVFATLVISSYADRSADRARLLIACVGATLLLSLGYLLPPRQMVVLGISLALAVVWPVQNTLCDSIALSGVRRFGADYSHMRVWGSIGYLAANLAGGFMLARAGTGAVPVFFSAGMAAAFLVCLFTPRLGAPRARVRDGVATTPLLRKPFFLLFVVAGGLIQASHAFFYSFSSIYWKSLGIGDAMIGALWASGVVAEVTVFAVFTPVFGRLTPLQILYASGAASILRWVLFPLVWPAGFGLAGFFAVQAMHGISTGLMILGVQKMIAQTVPEHQTGGAQGIAYFAGNFSLAAATLASGWFYQEFGPRGFFAMASIAAVGLAAAIAARGLDQPQSAGSGG